MFVCPPGAIKPWLPKTVIVSISGSTTTTAPTRPSRQLAPVHRLDLGLVLLADRLALQFHRRSQLLPTGVPILTQDGELLDPLHVGHLLVHLIDRLLDLFEKLRAR